MINEFINQKCTNCDDIMTMDSNYQPYWSDKKDNVICWTCYNEIERNELEVIQ